MSLIEPENWNAVLFAAKSVLCALPAKNENFAWRADSAIIISSPGTTNLLKSANRFLQCFGQRYQYWYIVGQSNEIGRFCNVLLSFFSVCMRSGQCLDDASPASDLDWWCSKGSNKVRATMQKYILRFEIYVNNDVWNVYWVMIFTKYIEWWCSRGKTKLDQWWIRKGKWYFPAQGTRLECYPPHYKFAILVQCRKRSPAPRLCGLSREKRDEEAKKRWIGSFLFAATMVAKISGPVWCNRGGEC